ncbi:autotransporter assembly complex family protein [Bdellovibrio bacteriovorus]|uniref:autotransporter assembly complex protein TamA n=1 Tax=Bdellovibrio TaxID=958 RepID=UPI0035A926B8
MASAKTRHVSNPCPQIEIHSEEKLEFTKTEIKWMCGDAGNKAWSVIPPWQARFFLKSFLQQRAYHHPKFTIDGNNLIVEAGDRTLLQEWTFLNAPPSFNAEKRRKMKGRPLTPELLNEVEAWSKTRLQNLGYACPEVTTQAFPDKGSVVVDLTPGDPYNFPTAETFAIRGTERSIYLDRYRAFLPGQKYDARLLQLTANRMILDEYHLSSYFDTRCSAEGVEIIPRLVTGDPHLVSAGAGFNTEVGAIGLVRYRHTQMNEAGSSFESKLYVSLVEQSLENSFQIYDGPPYRDRTYWSPQLNFKNELESTYKSFTTDVGLRWGITKEFEEFSSRFQLGPFYTYNNVETDTNVQVLRTVTSTAEVSLQSHDYEYYAAEPRAGWIFSTNIRSAYEGLGADQTFHQWVYQHQILWNYSDWDPPLVVFGWRFKAGTFLMTDDTVFTDVVPENLRFYLGGDSSLRGFSRKQIPFTGEGSATFLYQGFEIRAGDVFPYKLQPFIFLDMAWESAKSLTLSKTLYYSPGIGIRWPSFIGPIRASISQGQTLWTDQVDIPVHWQGYLSLGREF